MNPARHIARIVIASLVFGLLAYPVLANDMAGNETWTHNRVAPQVALPPVPQNVVLDQAAAGRKCATTPALTDHVVFTYTDGATQVVDFDTALEDGKAHRGTVRLYCR